MPSSSAKQAKLMRAVAHNPAFAKKVGIPQSVGKDFSEADKGRKFGSGGTMKESKAMVKKEMAFMKKKGAPKSMIKHEEREHESFGMGRKTKKMAGGGMPEVTVTGTRRNPSVEGKVTVEDLGRYEIPSVSVEELGTIEEPTARDKAPAPRRGTVTVEPYEPGGMKRGGSVKSGGYRRVADGIASKGKTRGMVVKMASGGSVGGSYRRAADGIATKGKTKGKMVKMMMGGSCK